jgi:hypothetical protein
MIVRALDANGDWTFGKGKNDYLVNREALKQILHTRLLSFLGDCFFALTAGIDWFNLLGSKDRLALSLAVNATILNTPQNVVTGILQKNFEVDERTRQVTLEYNVQSIYGSLDVVFQYDLNGLV